MEKKVNVVGKHCIKGIILITLGLFLSGCCIRHEWQEATCTQPRTCAKCGETEGDPLTHEWQEATCTQPRTCNLCGETEGEALGHQVTEANYQSPAYCTVCGEVIEEAWTPDFEVYNLSCDAEENTAYDYVTGVYDAQGVETVAQIVFSDYRTFQGDETHPAKEGYEWKTIHATITFNDDNSRQYGALWSASFDDYYNIEQADDSSETIENMYDALYTSQFTVNYNGVDYTECIKRVDREEVTPWNTNADNLVETQFSFLVPTGYDGMVLGFVDARYQFDDSLGDEYYTYDIADENSIFFRMN